MLVINGLTKTYGEKTAVDGLSLHIQPGEIYGFIGPTGAGKTTTLKSVCGLLPFDKGEIQIGGVSVTADPIACKKQLAYVPDKKTEHEITMRPEGIESVHPHYAISWRNNWMLRQTDSVANYVAHSWGRVAQYTNKALRQRKIIIKFNER